MDFGMCNRQIPCPWQGMPKIRVCEGPFLATFRQPDLLTPLSALHHVDRPLEGTYESRCLHEGFPSLVFLDSKSTLGTDGTVYPGLAQVPSDSPAVVSLGGLSRGPHQVL